MKYSREIDGLRAVAVLSVVLFHLGVESVSGGFVGVDVFFTISGYLITSIILRDINAGRFSILQFWQRRARRILPALFVVVLVCLLAAWFILFPLELMAFGGSVIAALLFASNFLFWSETGYFDLLSELKPLLHTWSLAVEEQFYLVIPWLLFFCHRAGLLALKSIFVALFALSFAAAVYWVNTDVEFAFYMPHARAWELLIGSLLAMQLLPAINSRLLRELMVVVGIAAIVYASVAYSGATPFPGLAAVLPCGGAALVIAASNSGSTWSGRWLGSRPMVGVGLISYSLYLWHWPLIVYVRYMTGDELTLPFQAVVLIASFTMAWLSWRWVETPVRLSEYWWGRRLFAGCVLTTLSIVFAGYLLIALQGAPDRLPPDYIAALELQYQNHDHRECHFVNANRVDRGDLCVLGAEGVAPSFVLAGDSHADIMSTPVLQAARQLGVAGYQFTQAGFRPLPGVQRLGSAKSGLLTDRFVLFLEENPSIKVVLLHGFWKVQATGSTFRHKGVVYIDDEYDGSGIAYNIDSFTNGLYRLVKQFPDRTFILLEDYPNGAEFDLHRLLRQLYFSGRSVAQLEQAGGMTRGEYQHDLETYRPALMNALGAGNVQLANIEEVLCDAEFCYTARDGEILYRDGDHLTLAGAAMFKDYFVVLLEEALNKPAGMLGKIDE